MVPQTIVPSVLVMVFFAEIILNSSLCLQLGADLVKAVLSASLVSAGKEDASRIAFQSESDLLQRLQHPNVVEFMASKVRSFPRTCGRSCHGSMKGIKVCCSL